MILNWKHICSKNNFEVEASYGLNFKILLQKPGGSDIKPSE
jgi:hypothetical protein